MAHQIILVSEFKLDFDEEAACAVVYIYQYG